MNLERRIQIEVIWERFLEGVSHGWSHTLGQTVGKAMYWSLIIGLGVFIAQESQRIKASCDACTRGAVMRKKVQEKATSIDWRLE